MISFEQAQTIIRQCGLPQAETMVSLMSCLGRRLSRDVHAPEDLPAFDNSAMDGWAVRGGDLQRATDSQPMRLVVQGEIAAGDCRPWVLERGKTLRIFTGAPMPKNADAVIMQEEVQEENVGGSAIFARPARTGENVRKAGEDMRKSALLLRQGTKIGAGQIGVLAALGMHEVPVLALPRVAHVATGSELVAYWQTPKAGQIRDSVGPMLRSALQGLGLDMQSMGIVPDNAEALAKAVDKALAFDVCLITGGVSVGKYDGVREILQQAGVETLFWKVDMKPGKPIYFGRRKDTLVFGLPGNPLSALVGFEFFVKPLLLRWIGEPLGGIKPRPMVLESDLTAHGARKTHVLTVTHTSKSVKPLAPQGSHRIGQLAKANGLAIVSELKKVLRAGEMVPVHDLQAQHA